MAQVTFHCKVKKTVWFYIMLILLRFKIYPPAYLFNRPIMKMYINGELVDTFSLVKETTNDQSGKDKKGRGGEDGV
jgi:hypothetical protein